MLPDERASEHVCRHLECLPPLPSTSHGQYDLYGRCRREPCPVDGGQRACEAGRGAARRMARLEVSGDGAVQGRAATSGARVELLSVHLQVRVRVRLG